MNLFKIYSKDDISILDDLEFEDFIEFSFYYIFTYFILILIQFYQDLIQNYLILKWLH